LAQCHALYSTVNVFAFELSALSFELTLVLSFDLWAIFGRFGSFNLLEMLVDLTSISHSCGDTQLW
jgi:hypothetical protein